MYQLQNQKVPILNMLSETLTAQGKGKITPGDVMGMITKKEIPGALVLELMQGLNKENGIFYQGMIKKNKTIDILMMKNGDNGF